MSVGGANLLGSSRRKKRWTAKKRKIEDFLKLVAFEKSKLPKIEKPDSDQSRSEMSSILSETKDDPILHLTERGLEAKVHLQCDCKEETLNQAVVPLVIEDVQQLLLKIMVNSTSSNDSLRWAKIANVKKISHVVLLIVDGLSKNEIVRNLPQFQHTLAIFPDVVEIVTPLSYNLSFATALCSGHITSGYYPGVEEDTSIGACASHKSLSNMVPNSKPPEVGISDMGFVSKKFSKLHLLLNVLQLALESYPLPPSVLEGADTKNYHLTKTAYSQVTAESPMFALDCEMCRMKSGKMAVTRIAVVNEKLDVIYETLVKPDGLVADYLKKYSGVDEEMLKPITTTLSDVQMHLQTLLPPDAILCGQSLNFDLHALNLIHPYVIDTSVIFNISGRRSKKPGLRQLSDTFLKMTIQDGGKGHDPIEDCMATMKLVQLKLEKGPAFGDTILANSAKPGKLKAKSANSVVKCDIKSLPTAQESGLEFVKDLPISIRFFPKLQSKGKNVCIVSDTVSYSDYPSDLLTKSVFRISEPNMKEAVEQSVELMQHHDLTVCHVNMKTHDDNENSPYTSLDEHIQKLYTACLFGSLFLVAITGTEQSYDCYENAMLMIRGINVTRGNNMLREWYKRAIKKK